MCGKWTSDWYPEEGKNFSFQKWNNDQHQCISAVVTAPVITAYSSSVPHSCIIAPRFIKRSPVVTTSQLNYPLLDDVIASYDVNNNLLDKSVTQVHMVSVWLAIEYVKLMWSNNWRPSSARNLQFPPLTFHWHYQVFIMAKTPEQY